MAQLNYGKITVLYFVSALMLSFIIASLSGFGEVIYVPADYPTIQQAVDAAAGEGDEIIVAAGTYNEAINFNGKAIYLHSADGPEATTIDAAGLETSVVIFTDNGSTGTILKGFTITGGTGIRYEKYISGGGIFANHIDAVISNCIFIENRGDYGGAIFANRSNITIDNCGFQDNGNINGFCGGAIASLYSIISVTGSFFTGNESYYYGGAIYGGAIISLNVSDCEFSSNFAYVAGAISVFGGRDIIIDHCNFLENNAGVAGAVWVAVLDYGFINVVNDCYFYGNQSNEYGGALIMEALYYSDSHMVNQCVFENNHCVEYGGAFDQYDAHTNLIDCIFIDNSAGIDGGAIDSEESTLNLDGCVFTGNWATENGGAIRNWNTNSIVNNCTLSMNGALGNGGGFYSYKNYSNVYKTELFKCDFYKNTATDDGGAVYEYNTEVDITNCTFKDNSANRGAGIFAPTLAENILTLANCQFIGNEAEQGGGVFHSGQSILTLTNSLFTGNQATIAGSAAYLSSPGGSMANCILWNNTREQISYDGDSPTVIYNDIEGGYEGIGNIDADPLFVDPVNGDYHLASGSPCIDAGNISVVPPDKFDLDGDKDTHEPIPIDFDGNPRLMDDEGKPNIGAGWVPILDMGAYEFQETSINALTILPMPLVANQSVEVIGMNAVPNTDAWLLYSLSGLGSKYINQLNVTVNLNNPHIAVGPLNTDEFGNITVTLTAPYFTTVKDIWFQGVQYGAVSNYVGTRIVP